MRNIAKNAAAGAVLGGSLLFAAGLGLANAQPDTTQDGQVNVVIGTAGVLEDVDVAAAAQIAAGVCDVEVDQVTSVVESVEANGGQQNVCTNNLGAVSVQQNGPGQSENAPGQAGETPTAPASPTTSAEQTEEPSADQN
ncbi:hypothetical protein [Mycolicibacterium sp. XJ1819]